MRNPGKLAAACFAAALSLGAGSAFGQAFPAKPIRFIMPYPPGGSSEILRWAKVVKDSGAKLE